MEFRPSPVKRNAVVNEVVAQFLEGVKTGTLTSGTKLPTERELADRFSVGRPVIREALRSLASLGIIEIKHGLGSFVSEHVYSSYLYATAFSEGWKTNAVMELMEVRKVIEPILAKMAAERASDEDVAEITRVLERQRAITVLDTAERQMAFHREDVNFHLAVARAAGNKMFFKMMMAVSDTLLESRKLSGRLEAAYEKAVAFHERIRDCIADRLPDQAMQAMMDHLCDVEGDLELAFEMGVGTE